MVGKPQGLAENKKDSYRKILKHHFPEIEYEITELQDVYKVVLNVPEKKYRSYYYQKKGIAKQLTEAKENLAMDFVLKHVTLNYR